EGSYTMIEKRQKRAMFLIQACGTLHLKKTDVQAVPAETYFASHDPCDLIVSRAFMPWRELLAFIDAALLPGGFAVFMMNDPLPPDVPEGWLAHSSKSYSVRGHVRYLWALRRGEN
ncbi:MAG: RsmG family class I SAM-dependent methyltransferase, partial [Desulfovibrio sp.]